MGCSQHSVDYGVAHIDIGACHIYLSSQYLASVGILAVFHLFEKSEIFLDASSSPRAFFTGLGKRTSGSLYFFRRIVAYVSKSFFDKTYRTLVHSVEIVGRIEFVVPFEAQPFDILFD